MAATKLGFTGWFVLQYRDPAGWGWRVAARNGVTLVGCDRAARRTFLGLAQPASWRFVLIDDAGYVGVDEADTHDAHGGWTEFAGVAGGTRPAWVTNAPNGGVLTGPSVPITLTAGGAIRGVGLATDPTAGSVSPAFELYSTAVLSAGQPVSAGGILLATYTVRLLPQG